MAVAVSIIAAGAVAVSVAVAVGFIGFVCYHPHASRDWVSSCVRNSLIKSIFKSWMLIKKSLL